MRKWLGQQQAIFTVDVSVLRRQRGNYSIFPNQQTSQSVFIDPLMHCPGEAEGL